MNTYSRGIRNAFRNGIRTTGITIITGLSIGLALAMLVAHQAVGNKIDSVKANVGNTITVSPAGFRGFSGTGNPLTTNQLSFISKMTHVTSVEETLSDRLTSSDTNLQSAVSLGQLGQRFLSGGGFGGGSGSPNSSINPTNSSPPVTVIGTTSPTDLNNTAGGGTFALKSGQDINGSGNSDVALVGTSLASKNNLKVGSSFTAYGATITVSGIFNSGNTFSNNLVILPLATEQRLSGQTGDVTSAIVNVDSLTNVTGVSSVIQKKLGSAADITTSSQQAENAVQPLQNIQSISLYSLIGAVIAGGVIILLTMIMIVRERRREIGVLKAIGANNWKVTAQFMTEAVTLTIMGAVLGIVVGTIGASPITNTLVSNSSSSSSRSTSFNGGGGSFQGGGGTFQGGGGFTRSRGFGVLRSSFTNVHAAVGWSIIAYGLLSALVIAVIGSFAVSFLISKVRPAEVMRVE